MITFTEVLIISWLFMMIRVAADEVKPAPDQMQAKKEQDKC